MSQDSNYVIYADASKCIGCTKCELACIASHNNMTIKEAAKQRKQLASRVRVVRTGTVKMAVQCHHCKDAPCVAICPTQALVQPDGANVTMVAQHCASCGLCMMACPYGAITKEFIKKSENDENNFAAEGHDRYLPVRCDLCVEWRAKEGKTVTACVETCPVDAVRMMPIEEFRLLQEKNRF